MARSRKHPSRWKHQHGAWYYRVPPGLEDQWEGKKWFRLGRTEAEAYRTWYERLGADGLEGSTMADVFHAYWKEAVTHLKPSTVDAYGYYLVPLRKVFGHMRPAAIKPRHVYAYMAERPKVSGHREAAVLSSVLSWAVSKGMIDANPIYGQVRKPEKPRERCPEPEELEAFLDTADDDFLRGYCALKRITGMRQSQLLAINLNEQWDGELLRIPGTKRGKTVEYEGEALRQDLNLRPLDPQSRR